MPAQVEGLELDVPDDQLVGVRVERRDVDLDAVLLQHVQQRRLAGIVQSQEQNLRVLVIEAWRDDGAAEGHGERAAHSKTRIAKRIKLKRKPLMGEQHAGPPALHTANPSGPSRTQLAAPHIASLGWRQSCVDACVSASNRHAVAVAVVGGRTSNRRNKRLPYLSSPERCTTSRRGT